MAQIRQQYRSLKRYAPLVEMVYRWLPTVFTQPEYLEFRQKFTDAVKDDDTDLQKIGPVIAQAFTTTYGPYVSLKDWLPDSSGGRSYGLVPANPGSELELNGFLIEALGMLGNDPDALTFCRGKLLHELTHWVLLNHPNGRGTEIFDPSDDPGLRIERMFNPALDTRTALQGMPQALAQQFQALEAAAMQRQQILAEALAANADGHQLAISRASGTPDATGSRTAPPFWPVVTDRRMALEIAYEDDQGTLHGERSRRFLADRAGGARYHVGIDLFANAGDEVVACENGRIVGFYGFYKRSTGEEAYALIIEHESLVINYGEVTKDSLSKCGLRIGDVVVSGQKIGFISGTSMLHFETYAPGTTHNYRWMKHEPRPTALRNPTPYLLTIAATGKRILPSGVIVELGAGASSLLAAYPGLVSPATPSPAPAAAAPAAPVPHGDMPVDVAADAVDALDFTSGGRPLTQAGFERVLAELDGLDPALLWAVFKKESMHPAGFMRDRRPLILFERHVFHKASDGKFHAFPDISSPVPYRSGEYGLYADQYDRLQKAMSLMPSAALMACSWGIGQTLGAGFSGMNYPSVMNFVTDMIASEDQQAHAVAMEIKHRNSGRFLRDLNFKEFAKIYNGRGAPQSYWEDLELYYMHFKQRGMPDIKLRQAQTMLVYTGYFDRMSQVDGFDGPATQGALKKFQSDAGIGQSGSPNDETMEKLQVKAFSG